MNSGALLGPCFKFSEKVKPCRKYRNSAVVETSMDFLTTLKRKTAGGSGLLKKDKDALNAAQHKEESKMENEQESMSWNDFNCKQVEEKPADPETHEICHVTKFGNWEFEGLEASVKRETEPRLTGHYEETPAAEAVESTSHLSFN